MAATEPRELRSQVGRTDSRHANEGPSVGASRIAATATGMGGLAAGWAAQNVDKLTCSAIHGQLGAG